MLVPSNLGNIKNLWLCPCNSLPAIYGHWWNFLLCLYDVFSPGMHLRFHVVDSVICGWKTLQITKYSVLKTGFWFPFLFSLFLFSFNLTDIVKHLVLISLIRLDQVFQGGDSRGAWPLLVGPRGPPLLAYLPPPWRWEQKPKWPERLGLPLVCVCVCVKHKQFYQEEKTKVNI